MNTLIKKLNLKKWSPYLIIITLASLLLLSPTFGLHFTGDDYQSFWRYQLYLGGYYPGNWNVLTYFLTDEGSRDTAMQIINSFFGFRPFYYYLISYLLRLLTAFSFIPIVFYFTKSRFASFLSAFFFSVTVIGLEATDWVFNMPVYLAITSLNIFLFILFKLKDKYSLKLLILSGILFILTVIMMPVRMTFLPVLVIIIEIYWFYTNKNRVSLKYLLFKIVFYLLLVVLIFSLGNFGNTIGVSPLRENREGFAWISGVENYFIAAKKPFTESKLLFLYIFGQIGSILFPNNIIPPNYYLLSSKRLLFFLIIPSLLLMYVFLKLLNNIFPYSNRVNFKIFFILSCLWAYIIWDYFIPLAWPTTNYLSFLTGGYSLILLLQIALGLPSKKHVILYFLIPILIIILSNTQFWLREPHSILLSFGRYLIVPAAGLSILIGVIYGFSKRKGLVLVLISIYFLLNIYGTVNYLKQLSNHREYHMAENIRTSIPNVFTSDNLEQPMIFFFEPANSKILHHTLLFGFPAFMSLQYNFMNNANLVYTDNWNEITYSYLNQKAPVRFGTPSTQPVKLENIYSFRLEGVDLVNTSEEIRNKLKSL